MLRVLIVGSFLLAASPVRADSECASPSTCRPACDKGDASACAWLGMYYARGVEMTDRPRAAATATKLLEAACAKSGAACVELVHVLRRDTKQQPDPKRVEKLLEAGCKLGEARGCKDAKQTQAMLEKQCTAGVPHACREAASAYGPDTAPANPGDPPPPPPDDESGGTGTAMALGNGTPAKPVVKPDPVKAKALRERAAKLVAEACAAGKARTCNDTRESAAELTAACKVGAVDACYWLARKAVADGKPWLDSAKRGCDLGDFVLCEMIASSYESGENKLAKDAAQAQAFFVKACDAFDGNACSLIAKATKDAAKQLALFQRACSVDEIYGCEQAADALLKTDAKQAIELFTKACDIEDGISALMRPICGELAARYETGAGVAKDAAKAKLLRKQGCERGEKKAC